MRLAVGHGSPGEALSASCCAMPEEAARLRHGEQRRVRVADGEALGQLERLRRDSSANMRCAAERLCSAAYCAESSRDARWPWWLPCSQKGMQMERYEAESSPLTTWTAGRAAAPATTRAAAEPGRRVGQRSRTTFLEWRCVRVSAFLRERGSLTRCRWHRGRRAGARGDHVRRRRRPCGAWPLRATGAAAPIGGMHSWPAGCRA